MTIIESTVSGNREGGIVNRCGATLNSSVSGNEAATFDEAYGGGIDGDCGSYEQGSDGLRERNVLEAPPCHVLAEYRRKLAFVRHACTSPGGRLANLPRAFCGFGESLGLFEPCKSLSGRESKPSHPLRLFVELPTAFIRRRHLD